MAQSQTWINYFVKSLHARGSEGHLPASSLAATIAAHDGSEAYHCAFDLVAESLTSHDGVATVSGYRGLMRPALGYVWFDFDSPDGGLLAFQDVKNFIQESKITSFVLCYSGSKGFHLGIPFDAFGLAPSEILGKQLNQIARSLKKKYNSLDTSVFNASRKLRALGSLHPKTNLYKTLITDLSLSFDQIRETAQKRGVLNFSLAPNVPVCELLSLASKNSLDAARSISFEEFKRYRQPEGTHALSECLFLIHCKDHPKEVLEPQWYAAAGIVGRFKDGRSKFHAISKGHPGYNVNVCDDKLEQALQSAGPRTCKGIQEIWNGCSACPHFEKIKSPIVILEKEVIPSEATGFYDITWSEDSLGKKIPRLKPNYNDLLRAYTRAHPFVTISAMKTPYLFNGTHYEPTNLLEIKSFAEEHFNPKPMERERSEFAAKILANYLRPLSFFDLGTRDKINFKNGVLDLLTLQLLPHSPEYAFRHVLPYDYNPDARCENFDKWLPDVLDNDEASIANLQEFMGYVLRGGEYKYHKALWLSGVGRNGKSTCLQIIKDLIGHRNYSTLSIKQIIHDRFAAAELDGKIANFSEETSPEELSDSGPFKNLTGDGETTGQRKYGDPYSFSNRAKIIMTYNEMPLLKDLSTGMLSRPIIIPFKKDLSDEASQDKTLKEKFRSELSGIFNFALEGWLRLEKQGRFTHNESSKQELNEIREMSDEVYQWFIQNVVVTNQETDQVSSSQCYAQYEATCTGNRKLGLKNFCKKLKYLPELKRFRFRTNQYKGYRGIKLVDSNTNNNRVNFDF